MNGMEDDGNEHNFSDDEFDTLPGNALDELEQYAIRSTQAPHTLNKSHVAAKQQSLPGNARQVASYSRPQPKNQIQPQPRKPQNGSQPAHRQPQDYDNDTYDDQTFDDQNDDAATPVEEQDCFIRVPQKAPSEMTQREQWRQQRFGNPHPKADQSRINLKRLPIRQNYQQPGNQDSNYLEGSYSDDVQDSMLLDQPQALTAGIARSVQEEALRAQIEELLRERDTLTTKLHDSTSAVLTQKGEIAIIRANQEKEAKTFDRQLHALKKSAEEEAAKHKAHLENMLAESKKLASDNRFLKHDLDEEVGRNSRLQKNLKEKPAGEKFDRNAITPQKATAHSLRDGFDDGELMVLSPSRSGRRSKGGTPTAGNKRKRKIDAPSPIRPLELRPSSEPAPPAKEIGPVLVTERIVPTVRKDPTAAKNLRFVQRIFNHRIPCENARIVEAFIKYTFPSDQSKTFTSIVLEATGQLSEKRLAGDMLAVFIDLWARSLKEKYYKCIASLAEVVNFIIDLEIAVVDIPTIQNLLPVLQASGEINGTIRFKNSPVSHQNLGKSRKTPQSELNNEIDGTACLEMLYNLACICLNDDKRIDRFWRSMNMDFVLLMLNSSQPLTDITLMLNLLSTSILPQTFGMISSSAGEQSKMETWILDRICYLLWERPRLNEGSTPPTKSQICTLRLEAMSLLNNLALASAPHPHNSSTHHGSLLLARHRSAIARLVRCIYGETDAMYLHSPSHALHAQLVNHGVRLLYHLLRNHGEAIDMQQKLLAINGGVHKHRVVLTRLAFSEGLFLDAGITQQTVDMATDMLEDAVTPEEAESLVEAFPGYKGRRRTQG